MSTVCLLQQSQDHNKKNEKCTLFVWQDNFFCCFCMLQLGLVKIFNAVNCLLLVNDYNRSQKLTTRILVYQSISQQYCQMQTPVI